MKKIFSITFLLFLLPIYSQYWKDVKDRCKISHKCFAEIHHDDFENTDVIVSGKSVPIGGAKPDYGTCSVGFKKILKDGLLVGYIATFNSNGALSYTGCITEGKSYISILFTNGEKLTLNYTGKIECGTMVIPVILSEANIETLLANPINKLRMNFADGPIDFVAKEKQIPNFMEQLKCIHEIQ